MIDMLFAIFRIVGLFVIAAWVGQFLIDLVTPYMSPNVRRWCEWFGLVDDGEPW